MRALTILAVLVFASGCASRVALSEPFEASNARGEAREQHDRLIELDRTVVTALRRSSPCEEDLCPVVERICELSESICSIATRHAGDRELESRCADGNRRCERARERVEEACGCEDAVEAPAEG